MGEMADEIIDDGMTTPCDWCGAVWPDDCAVDCERVKRKRTKRKTRETP